MDETTDATAPGPDEAKPSETAKGAPRLDEAAALDALGIESWQQLSGDKVGKLAALLPRLEKALAPRIAEQVPDFKGVVRELLDTPTRESEATRDFNQRSQEHVHQAYKDVRTALQAELAKDDLSTADRVRVLELLLETANRESAKDSENKQFLFGLVTVSAMALVSVAGTVAAIVASGRSTPGPRRLDPPAPPAGP